MNYAEICSDKQRNIMRKYVMDKVKDVVKMSCELDIHCHYRYDSGFEWDHSDDRWYIDVIKIPEQSRLIITPTIDHDGDDEEIIKLDVNIHRMFQHYNHKYENIDDFTLSDRFVNNLLFTIYQIKNISRCDICERFTQSEMCIDCKLSNDIDSDDSDSDESVESIDTKNKCGICLSTHYVDKSRHILSKRETECCGTTYHSGCITKCINRNQKCPNCRQENFKLIDI